MFPLKKLIAPILLIVTILPMPSVMALTLQQAVNNIQAIDPNLPTGVANPKGSIGYLLAELFYGTGDGSKNGKIKPQYIDYSGISAWTQSGSDAFYSGTGGVGIGTTNPSAKLHIKTSAGQFKVGPAGWNSIQIDIRNNADTAYSSSIFNANEHVFQIDGNSAKLLSLSPIGNVGIGTIAASDLLTLSGSSGPIIGLNGPTANYRGLKMSDNAGVEKWFAGANNLGNYVIRQNAATDLMTFSGGNVGIGTTTPRAALEVTGRNIIFGITPTTIGYASSGYPGIGYNFSAQTDGTWKYLISDTAYMIGLGQGHRYDFNYAPAGVAGNVISWATAMSVLNNGNVGIGTTSPQGKLDVRGPVIVATPDYIVGSVGSAFAVGMGATSGNTYAALDSYINGGTSFGNIVLHPAGNGNVGIGTPSPSTKLDVLGTIRNSAPSAGYLELSGDLPGYGASTYPTLKTNGSALYFSVWGAYSAWMSAGWVLTAVSDKNKKENFRDLDYGEILGKIDALSLKEWNYKMEDKSIRHIGPFAQDFHALFGLNGPDDKMISNIDPTGVALAGIKGLSEKEKIQEARLDDLQKQNQELKYLVCLDHPDAEACK